MQYECFLPTQQQPSTESTEVVNLDAPSQLDLVRKRLEKPKQTCLQLVLEMEITFISYNCSKEDFGLMKFAP